MHTRWLQNLALFHLQGRQAIVWNKSDVALQNDVTRHIILYTYFWNQRSLAHRTDFFYVPFQAPFRFNMISWPISGLRTIGWSFLPLVIDLSMGTRSIQLHSHVTHTTFYLAICVAFCVSTSLEKNRRIDELTVALLQNFLKVDGRGHNNSPLRN